MFHEQIENLKKQVEDLNKGQKLYPHIKFLPEVKRKRILVTGGAGFVGSHLVDRLRNFLGAVSLRKNFAKNFIF